MDFSLSEEQRLLAEALGRYLEESVSPARVREIAASDEGKRLAEGWLAGKGIGR